MPKRTICRKHYMALRNEMTQDEVITKSAAICEKVINSTIYINAQVILAYYPLGNEVNCLPILADALKNGKKVMLSRTETDCQMNFYEIGDFSDVEEGNFHVKEPKSYCKKYEPDRFALKACALVQEGIQKDVTALVLVPGVVFDRFGNRYGYGKGYYDRYFARFPGFKRIALAYTEQLSEEPLECLETDVKMHGIVTEDEIVWMD